MMGGDPHVVGAIGATCSGRHGRTRIETDCHPAEAENASRTLNQTKQQLPKSAMAQDGIGATLASAILPALHLNLQAVAGKLKDSEWMVRRAAVCALARLEPAERDVYDEALDELRTTDPDNRVRRAVAEALG